MKTIDTSLFRFFLIIALFIGTGLFLRARSHPEKAQVHAPLASFPLAIGGWTGRDVQISADVLAILGPGEFLSRIYQSPTEPYIDFFLAYFPNQKSGDSIHSPKNCLPGAGWSPVESGRMQLSRPNEPAIEVNRYVIAKADSRMLVLYWYQSHGRAVASEYWAKYYLVADAVHMNRTDGGLVRVITPMVPGETTAAAEGRAVRFTQKLFPFLDRYIPI